MLNCKLFYVALAAVLLTSADRAAMAQSTSQGIFCITVSEAIGIVGPTAPVAIYHDGTINANVFPPATWSCIANDADGSVATFTTLTGMVNSAQPLIARDCKLDLTVTSADAGSGWTTTVASDQTDITAVIPDLSATVQAESTGPGNATLDLTVSFLTGDLSTLSPGIYCATVVATITSK